MMKKSECPTCAASIAPSSDRCDFCGQWFETPEKRVMKHGGVNDAIQVVGKLAQAANGMTKALGLVINKEVDTINPIERAKRSATPVYCLG